MTIAWRRLADVPRDDPLLRDLMAKHIVVAPNGASENWSPPRAARTPTATFANDGGYEFKQKIYAQAAAGRPQPLEQSCRANGAPVTVAHEYGPPGATSREP